MQRQKRRRKRRLITLSVRLLAAFIMSVMLVGIAVVVLLTGGRESYFIYAEENPSEKSAKDGADENEPVMIIIPDEPAKQEIQASTSENTVSGDDPAVEPMVRIAITEPDGWYSKAVKIKVIAEDIASTGNFTIKTVKARIGQNGSWTDITDTMSVEMSENSTVYVEVADTKGNVYSKNGNKNSRPVSRPGRGKLCFNYPSIMMVFFSGIFLVSILGMFRLNTPFSSFAPMSVSVSASPT